MHESSFFFISSANPHLDKNSGRIRCICVTMCCINKSQFYISDVLRHNISITVVYADEDKRVFVVRYTIFAAIKIQDDITKQICG